MRPSGLLTRSGRSQERPLTASSSAGPSLSAFARAFDLALKRYEPSIAALVTHLEAQGVAIDRATLRTWRLGQKPPSKARSFMALALLERRWRLPDGYFRRLLPHSDRAVGGRLAPGLTASEKRRYLWHLPEDFAARQPAERAEILAWVRRTFRSTDSEYRRYQSLAVRHAYAIRFPALAGWNTSPRAEIGRRLRPGTRIAPQALSDEMGQLLAFKTATFAPIGFARAGVWGAVTAAQKLEHLGLLFGALSAPPDGPSLGLGAPLEALSFALLLFPGVWDAYLGWRERRRGFFTVWEIDLLCAVGANADPRTGWIAQTPGLADRLQALDGMVTEAEVAAARSDWRGACARFRDFARMRVRELKRIVRRHHDPFEPVLPVLRSDSPVAEYRKIADEIRLRRPCAVRNPRAAAENARAYLMVRLALHLGFRQRTLRELLVRGRGERPTPDKALETVRRGEMRWNDLQAGWEVFAPPVAFKNNMSNYFCGRPFRLVLPDVAGLYAEIDTYLNVHRPVLIGAMVDPGTFFVRVPAKPQAPGADASFSQADFYSAWRALTGRYGVYNPYTGRGAIPGLLPHGPHCVRHVLATHIIKLTGSFEQAGYAIQDAPKSVERHYGVFLPQDKAAQATRLLNAVWAEGQVRVGSETE
ncbi:hypothetical protein [Phenylobacterium sp.]|uniref:hypothetical protein n=1 Tax=Phenylobacterium sp. TaxID=1871053 RepID=UPI001207858A|nr:hypothetical protein [Phenylobacterium sp.]THD59060.1 MAG: hypothetical protein E8A49_17380 [Phenylobacterium sp.]